MKQSTHLIAQFSIVVMILICAQAFGQTPPNDTVQLGEVRSIQSREVTLLLSTDKKINDSLKTIHGFRVQIYFGTGGKGRKEAQEVMEKFIENHPGIDVYDPVEFPNFKVRVGNCRSQLDALKLQAYLKNDYPHAFIVKEDIELPSLVTPDWAKIDQHSKVKKIGK